MAAAYVSRAGHKLDLALPLLDLDLRGKVVIDVGASTGGFTQVAVARGARKVYAVEIGTRQLHSSLRDNPKVVVMEKTDINAVASLPELAEVALVDVSFVPVEEILPHLATLLAPGARIVTLVKPQFEAKRYYPEALNHGIIKNKTYRRKILKAFEAWITDKFLIQNKVDSEIPGAKGNLERFYSLVARG